MKLLIATFFIALAGFTHSMGSPKRWYNHKHAALDEAGFSGRTDDELLSEDLEEKGKIKYATEAFSSVSHHNDNGIFYEENGRLHAVRTGMPLLECGGHIVGRPKDGHVVPVYDSDGYPVQANGNNYKWQTYMHVSNTQKDNKIRIPHIFNIVPARLPREPKVLYSDASIKPGKLDVKQLDETRFPKPHNNKP